MAASTGFMARHGPHQAAQKSTSTGPGSSSTSRLKLYCSRSITHLRSTSLLRGGELLDALAGHFGDVHIAARIDAEHVGHLALPGRGPLLAEAAQRCAVRAEYPDPVRPAVGHEESISGE